MAFILLIARYMAIKCVMASMTNYIIQTPSTNNTIVTIQITLCTFQYNILHMQIECTAWICNFALLTRMAFVDFSVTRIRRYPAKRPYQPCLRMADRALPNPVCQKGPTRHAYAWQIGPFWQHTLNCSRRRDKLIYGIRYVSRQYMILVSLFWSSWNETMFGGV